MLVTEARKSRLQLRTSQRRSTRSNPRYAATVIDEKMSTNAPEEEVEAPQEAQLEAAADPRTETRAAATAIAGTTRNDADGSDELEKKKNDGVESGNYDVPKRNGSAVSDRSKGPRPRGRRRGTTTITRKR